MTQGGYDETAGAQADTGGMAKIIYVLYLVGLVVGITPVVGLVMAYIYRDGAPDWLRGHYTYQIRTFWVGLLYLIIGIVTCFILIGWVVLLFTLIWYVVRCVKGLKLVGEGRAVLYPRSWWF